MFTNYFPKEQVRKCKFVNYPTSDWEISPPNYKNLTDFLRDYNKNLTFYLTILLKLQREVYFYNNI